MNGADIELVALARAANNNAAFTELVRRHQAKLRAFLQRLSGDATIADDIAQEAFLKAHARLDDFRGGGSFRSWLFAIAYREFLQDRRRKAAAAKLEKALREEICDEAQTDSASMQASLSIDLRRALMTLQENERAALLLCDAAGLSHSEAARAIEAPLGSVKTYIARGRAKMRSIARGAASR